MNCLFTLVGTALLLVGLAFVFILLKIGGKSDGPGAILFYIGAFIGLGGAWAIFTSGRPKE